MRLVFANSAWVDAPERFILRGGAWRRRALRVRFGLLLHPTQGPVLIDTGYTDHAVSGRDRSRALRIYSGLLRPRLVPEEQPEAVLARYGFAPRDVKSVIVTHFHADHVSGLKLFPNAQFHTVAAAWARVAGRSAHHNLRHGIFTELLPADFSARLAPLEDCAQVRGLGAEPGFDVLGDGRISACPLPGHAEGHFGLAIHLPERTVLYAVDTQWMLAALPKSRRPGLVPRLIADAPDKLEDSTDLVARFGNQAPGDVILCHDPDRHALDYTAAAP